MKVVTAEQMREIDRKTIEGYGLPGPVLMERAGLSVARKVKDLYERRKVIVLCGGGNNGGDGIVAARELFTGGWNVKVLLVSKEEKLSRDCLAQYKIARKMGVPLEFRAAVSGRDLHSAVVIDALFGTGLNKTVGPPFSEIIRFLNRSDAPVVSVDIPSGISSDTGEVMGDAVRADHTITFGLPKVGHKMHPGAEFTGTLFVEDIGFPGAVLKSDSLKIETVEAGDVSVLIPERHAYSYKGDYGHVLVVAGSRGKTGAAMMTAKACLRTGAGMVTIGVPETLADIFQSRVTEEMVLPLPDTGEGMLSERALEEISDFLGARGDVLAIGPGLTPGKERAAIIRELLLTATVPMVLDADAVNSLSGQRDLLRKTKAPVVLTPHAGEMARLLGGDAGAEQTAAIERDRIGTASSFVKESGACLVLKGVPTVTAEPEGRVFINTTGNAGMATAGSGDVLTGIISSLLGQGLNPSDASVLGVFLHGLAGDIASEEEGMHSLVASDIIGSIHKAFLRLGGHGSGRGTA